MILATKSGTESNSKADPAPVDPFTVYVRFDQSLPSWPRDLDGWHLRISVSDRASAAHLDSILKVTLSNLRSRYRTRKSPAFNDPRSICWRLIQLLIYGKVRAFEDQTCSMPPDLTSNPLPSTDGLLHKLNWAASFYAIKKIIAEGEPTTGLSAACLPAIATVLLDVQACMGQKAKYMYLRLTMQ